MPALERLALPPTVPHEPLTDVRRDAACQEVLAPAVHADCAQLHQRSSHDSLQPIPAFTAFHLSPQPQGILGSPERLVIPSVYTDSSLSLDDMVNTPG